jgi:hypothetical protein
MTTQQLMAQHNQLYRTSCSPSLIEILLKLEGLVAPDWFEEQEKHKGDNVGLEPYLNQAVHGGTIRRIQDELSPEVSFVGRIDQLLADDKALGIYLRNPDGSGFHGWMIYGRDNDGRYLAATKGWNPQTNKGDQTILAKIEAPYLEASSDRDCIYIERAKESPTT